MSCKVMEREIIPKCYSIYCISKVRRNMVFSRIPSGLVKQKVRVYVQTQGKSCLRCFKNSDLGTQKTDYCH